MYLLRLDDASEHWNKQNWLRMHDLLQKYWVKPLVGVIPHNEYEKLLSYPLDPNYWATIHRWIDEGWMPGLHGYNHVLDSKDGGINPVNYRSEFAGKPILLQQEKIRRGYEILQQNGIVPHVFIAPAHTFDKNTLDALRKETDIRIISDTIADDVYWQDGFYYIPQQSGSVRALGFSITTFCYHPNTMLDEHFAELETFLKKHHSNFKAFEDVPLKKRSLNIKDRTIRAIYFAKRRLFVKR